jgi:glutamine amidotransferase-like uncharacterized protein
MKRIALFINHPKCSVQSANGVMNALPNYHFKIFTKHEVEDNFFDDCDLICVPGGVGEADSFDTTLIHHKDKINEFVKKGKPYLGICMGAYWADKLYLDILDQVRVVQYIKLEGSCTRRPHAKAMHIRWEDKNETMFFNDGCTFQGTNFQSIAFYPTFYPAAIIQDNIGLIGVHPESEPMWYEYHTWMKHHYHGGRHAELLSNFVTKLEKT